MNEAFDSLFYLYESTEISDAGNLALDTGTWAVLLPEPEIPAEFRHLIHCQGEQRQLRQYAPRGRPFPAGRRGRAVR